MQDSLLEPSALECTICLERMRDVSFLVTSPDDQGNVCNHWFCTACITPLVENAKKKGKTPSCPSCRREILSIVKSRFGSELCYEVEKERQCSKQLQKDKQQLEAKFKQTAKEKNELETLYEKHKKMYTTKCEGLEKETAVLKQQNEKLQKENIDMKLSYETQITRLQTQLQELTEASMLSKQDSQRAQSILQVERKQNEELSKQIQKLQADLQSKTDDAEKYQRLYSRTLQELNAKQFNANDKPKDTNGTTDGYLKSWLSPKFDFSSSTSYLSNINLGSIGYYLKPSRTGPLLRPGSDFLFVERRGSSKTPTVWKVALQQPLLHKGRTVAAKKILDVNSKKSIVDAYREAMLLWKFDHQNILKVECILREELVPSLNIRGDFIIFPFVEYDLEYILSDPFTRKQMDEGQIRSIVFQVLSALYFLHSANVVHRDVKPTSILLDEKGHVKLGSLGSAISLLDETAPNTPISSYTPPENCYSNTATNSVSGSATVNMASRPMDHWKAGDVWMLGMVLVEMVSRGSVLFDCKERVSLLPKIFSMTETKPSPQDMFKHPSLNGVIPSDKEISLADWLLSKRVDIIQGNNPFLNNKNMNSIQSNRYTMSLECFQLIRGMIHFDPGQRLTAKECLEHSFFTSAKMVDVHRTCLLASELTSDDVQKFVIQNCGGL
mmetsp:Transcript_25273/g.35405  ORF Transcript_25273/g.35405 Transcript_25273/m.35405 type:complete len:668 (+) Transcript_25273:114-2117(+)